MAEYLQTCDLILDGNVLKLRAEYVAQRCQTGLLDLRVALNASVHVAVKSHELLFQPVVVRNVKLV